VKQAPTHATPRSPQGIDLQRLRAIMSNGHVRHIGRDARAHYFARIYHVTHDDRYNRDDHDYPDKVFPGYNGYKHK
jgi:hypothetical protein